METRVQKSRIPWWVVLIAACFVLAAGGLLVRRFLSDRGHHPAAPSHHHAAAHPQHNAALAMRDVPAEAVTTPTQVVSGGSVAPSSRPLKNPEVGNDVVCCFC